MDTKRYQYVLYASFAAAMFFGVYILFAPNHSLKNMELAIVQGQQESIIVRARGTNDREKIGLFINEQPRIFWNLSNTWDDYTFSPDSRIEVDTLTVEFLNDYWKPEEGINYDVQIDHVRIGDQMYESEDQSTFSTGTWDQNNWCAPGAKQNEWLHCNGGLSYAIAANTTVGPSDISKPSLIDLCDGKCISHSQEVTYRQSPKPDHLSSFQDPIFGTQITRITNAPSGATRKTLYSTIQAWNADESRLILYHAGDGHHLYDGGTYEHLRKIEDVTPADLEEIFWDPENANEFYYIDSYDGNQGTYGSLIRYNVATKNKQIVKDFSTVCQGKIVGGSDVHMMSWDGEVIGARCGGGTPPYVAFAYHIGDDRLIGPINNNFDFRTAPMPAPSGQRFYFRGTSVDTNLDPLHSLVSKDGEHASIGRVDTGDGTFHDAYVAVSFGGDPCGPGNIIVHDMETGTCKSVIGEQSGFGYTQSSTHLSALSHKNPGWIAASSIGYEEDVKSTTKPPFSGEIYLAYPRLSGEDLIYRLTHHHSWGKFGNAGYFAEPHPVISPTGSRILFSSDWGNSGTVDTYVIDLRANSTISN